MRYFNDYPKRAFEWLSTEMQDKLSKEAKLQYGGLKHDEKYYASPVREVRARGRKPHG
ncbi:hypothetical protein MUP79_07800 [Candidatus Bathyarchaeota archaeon]|nr:hypothetical protein [Candidatus Bathyarchaeota archaeon]